ncbi:MAG: UbiA family prenyltransferase [Candidatus Kariarchaeaceae archaeon]
MGMATRNQKLQGLFQIIRPVSDMVVGFGILVGLVLGGSIDREMGIANYALLFVAGFLLSAHAMVVNDIIDFDIDLINQPKRVLPAGVFSKKIAAIYSVILGLLGILCCYMVDLSDDITVPFTWLWALSHLLLVDLYNLKFKKTGFFGNIIVAYTSLASFLYADLFFNEKLTLLPFTFGIMSFLANLAREIIKGIMDEEGDRQHDVKTIAVVLGSRIARSISLVFVITCMVISIIVFFELTIIGKIGILLFLINFTYVASLVYRSIDPFFARKGKHFILLGPIILTPFLIIDRIIAA